MYILRASNTFPYLFVLSEKAKVTMTNPSKKNMYTVHKRYINFKVMQAMALSFRSI